MKVNYPHAILDSDILTITRNLLSGGGGRGKGGTTLCIELVCRARKNNALVSFVSLFSPHYFKDA